MSGMIEMGNIQALNGDAINSAILASHNPREALNRIGHLTTEARQHLRNKDTTRAMVCLNKIAQFTGAL
jgi:hypothetical protein